MRLLFRYGPCGHWLKRENHSMASLPVLSPPSGCRNVIQRMSYQPGFFPRSSTDKRLSFEVNEAKENGAKLFPYTHSHIYTHTHKHTKREGEREPFSFYLVNDLPYTLSLGISSRDLSNQDPCFSTGNGFLDRVIRRITLTAKWTIYGPF